MKPLKHDHAPHMWFVDETEAICTDCGGTWRRTTKLWSYKGRWV